MQLSCCKIPPSQTLSYRIIPITCITRQIFREDCTVSVPKREKHCVSARLYTDSSRPAVDAVNGAEALGRATVLRKDSSDGEQMEPHVRVADEVEQAGIGEEGFRKALGAERERDRTCASRLRDDLSVSQKVSPGEQ